MPRLLATIFCLVFFQGAVANCNDDADQARIAGDADESIRILNDCLDNKLGRVARTWLLLGLANYDKAQYATAIEYYDQAIEAVPGYAAAWANRGLARSALGENDDAMADVDRALSLDPSSMQAWYISGTIWEKLEKEEAAIADYTKALTLESDDHNRSNVYYRRAMLYLDDREREKAMADLDGAITEAPDFTEAYFKRARLHQRADNYDAALADYSRVIELDPERAEAFYQRAEMYKKKKMDHLALRDYDRALELNPNIKTYAKRGMTYLLPLFPVLLVLFLG